MMEKLKFLTFISVWSICLLFGVLTDNASADGVIEKRDYFQPCKIYQPGFTKCSTESIQKLMTQLGIGIPEIIAIGGNFDPMTLDRIPFRQDNNGAVTINANLTNVKMTGLSKMVIKQSKVSKKDFSWDTLIFIPKLRLEGNYQMAGRILLIPLSGNGHMFLDLDKLDINMHTTTRLYEKEGLTFYNITKVRCIINIQKTRTYFDNLFNGRSKEIERSTNQFFNDNWREFYEALRPLITEVVERTIHKLYGIAFSVIPANYLVEDIPTSVELYAKKKT